MGVSFKASKEEHRVIFAIAERAVEIAEAADLPVDFLTIEMDVTAAHCSGCPLRLQELLDSGDADFAHDVFGIHQHIDRKTGNLGGCFLPRCAR